MIKFPPKKYKINSYNFEEDYIKTLNSIQKKLDKRKIAKICKLFEGAIRNKNRVFVLGNGGSAAVSNHFVCDFNKGLGKMMKNNKAKFISLTNSIELITAVANDISYNKIFTNQLENFYEKGDIIYIMSCSGLSKNIIEALKFANFKKAKVVFITGFLRKKLNYRFNVFINLKCENYGICEDIFSSIMHMTYQKLKIQFSKDKNKII